MKGGAVFFIAIRYLLGRAREGGRYLRGAAAGIAVSLVPIIVTLIVSDGMIRGITDRYIELGTGHIQVYCNEGIESWDGVIARLKESGLVRGAWVEGRGVGVLLGKKGKTGAAIRVTDPSFWNDPGSARFLEVVEGSGVLENDTQVMLGQSLAESAEVHAGGTVRVMTVRTADDGRNIPRMMPFTVKGVVSSGYRELDALWCVMTPEGGRRLLPGAAGYLVVKINDPYGELERTAWAIEELLGPAFTVFTWKDLIRSQYQSYESTKQLLLFIMAMIVLVAAVNVSSATSMLTIERERDIAVLKAQGAGPPTIAAVFLCGGCLTGLTGAVVGSAAGLCIGFYINGIIRALEQVLSNVSVIFHGPEVKILDPGFYLETIPIIIDWKMVCIILGFTVICSTAAAVLPALRAGKLKPLDLLRKH